MNSMRLIRNLAGGIINIVYPKTCHVCKDKIGTSSIGGLVCSGCWAKIKINLPPFCRQCGRSLAGARFMKDTCAGCFGNIVYFDRAFSPCSYEGVVKELIHAFKYKNKDYLGDALSRLMIDFVKEYNLPIESMDLIVPVPLSKTRLREREYNHALILAGGLGREFNKSVVQDRLIRHRNTGTQTELEDTERFLNVKGAFSVNGQDAVRRKNILLVDDVLTTGATCSEAALTLKEAGANAVYVLTLAS